MKYNIYPSYVWQSIFFISFLSNVTEMKKIMYHPFFFQQKHFLICFFLFFYFKGSICPLGLWPSKTIALFRVGLARTLSFKKKPTA